MPVVRPAVRLAARLAGEVRAALARGPELTLARLVGLQRTARLRVERRTLHVSLRGPKARAQAAERERDKTPSVLKQVATDRSGGNRIAVHLDSLHMRNNALNRHQALAQIFINARNDVALRHRNAIRTTLVPSVDRYYEDESLLATLSIVLSLSAK